MAKGNCDNQDMIIEHSKILDKIPGMAADIHLIKTKLIDGNGEPGLLTQHQVLKTEYENHIEKHNSHDSTKKWIIGLAIAVLLSTFATIYQATNHSPQTDKYSVNQIDNYIKMEMEKVLREKINGR